MKNPLFLDNTFEDIRQFLNESFIPVNIKLSLRPHTAITLTLHYTSSYLYDTLISGTLVRVMSLPATPSLLWLGPSQ